MSELLASYAKYRKGIIAALGALMLIVPEVRSVVDTLLVVVPDLSTEVISVLTAAGVVGVRNDA